MKDLNVLTYDCINELASIGINPGRLINVYENTRAKKRNGQCKRLSNGTFEININTALLDDNMSDFPVKNTIMHELIHTMQGAFNHGPIWQGIAEKVNNSLGYKIKRCNNYDEYGINRNINYKYMFKCDACGNTFGRQRESQFTRNYTLYRCKCGGKLNRIR